MVREHKITWIETERPLPTGTATTSERSLHITGPGVYSLSLVAAPNTCLLYTSDAADDAPRV